MPKEVFRIGVMGRSHPPASRWGGRVLRPHAVTEAPLPLAPGTLMHDDGGVHTVWLGDHELVLHHGETGHYRTNLASARPSVWVSMDAGRVHLVTPDPYEGESLASDPARVVEAVAMPPGLMAAVAAFIAQHHVEEVFHKRRRTRATGQYEADPRAPRILSPDQKWGRK
ncbi:MAG: DUF3305 domain-containing protein [Gemmobacter sp.]